MGQAVSRVAQYRSMIDRTKQKYKESKTALMREKEQQQETEKTIRRLNQVGQILQVVVSSIQNEVHKEISNIVTRCLQAVFSDDSYTFKIVFEYKRGRTEARLLFERDGQEFDPLSSTGGGVVDVAAFG
jgi:hypothetical protein